MFDLNPIKTRLALATFADTHDIAAELVAEVERLREALAYEIETVGKCGEEIARLEAEIDRMRPSWQTVDFLEGKIERLRAAIRTHRDGWHRSENRMLVDRVVMRAAQARELWAVLDA